MINEQLIAYIKQELESNISKSEITNVLLSKGWPISDIEENFNFIALPASASTTLPNLISQPNKPQLPTWLNMKLIIISSLGIGAGEV